ncbi:hypothetical protein BX616_002234 [Lobosporangium transversale]|uniref:Uncharacterized protein n=1 Tax=Lobosporangium transversale TaxID=64571 RepID=A0A1Y2GML2_9FUNG|nr:hypothetical protein BCR41DRAFT_370639 [Lobosporangium transversale]KAF9901507.1 hypothetical protein BX616_002234 [Lobosporangium transversale]ORZ16031.1 hypothetical protein BCR41DRAFT_370639 [Lobosporangium transversale]|eukprot:XP_021881378.1 hypothetical protein BCR41DRAFT_370639 [Lobosporangium transversale]
MTRLHIFHALFHSVAALGYIPFALSSTLISSSTPFVTIPPIAVILIAFIPPLTFYPVLCFSYRYLERFKRISLSIQRARMYVMLAGSGLCFIVAVHLIMVHSLANSRDTIYNRKSYFAIRPSQSLFTASIGPESTTTVLVVKGTGEQSTKTPTGDDRVAKMNDKAEAMLSPWTTYVPLSKEQAHHGGQQQQMMVGSDDKNTVSDQPITSVEWRWDAQRSVFKFLLPSHCGQSQQSQEECRTSYQEQAFIIAKQAPQKAAEPVVSSSRTVDISIPKSVAATSNAYKVAQFKASPSLSPSLSPASWYPLLTNTHAGEAAVPSTKAKTDASSAQSQLNLPLDPSTVTLDLSSSLAVSIVTSIPVAFDEALQSKHNNADLNAEKVNRITRMKEALLYKYHSDDEDRKSFQPLGFDIKSSYWLLFIGSQGVLVFLLVMLLLGVLILTEYVLDQEDEDCVNRTFLYWGRIFGVTIATVTSAIHGSILSGYVLIDGLSDWIAQAAVGSICLYWVSMVWIMNRIIGPLPY